MQIFVSLVLTLVTSLASVPAPFSGCPGPTGGGAVVIVPAAPAIATASGAVEPGDTVALFSPSGQCLGSALLDGSPLAVAVWGDDPFTDSADGFLEGEVPHFRVFDASDGTLHALDVVVTFAEGHDPSGGLLSGGVYVVGAMPVGPAWLSEIDASSETPYVEVAGAGPGSRWLAGLDDAGLVRWVLSLSGQTPTRDGLLIVRAQDVLGLDASSGFLDSHGQPGAIALGTGAQPETGAPIAGLDVEDVVVLGGADAPRGGTLLAATGQTVQYVASVPLSRAVPGGLLLPAPPTPAEPNAEPIIPGGPDMARPPGWYHLLSLPIVGAAGRALSVGDLGALGPLIGVSGSETPLDAPNVWTGFDVSGALTVPSSVDVTLPPGRGVVWTWPAEEGSRTGAATSRLALQGRTTDDATGGGPHAVSFAAAAPDGHYLVGNPYAYPLRLNGVSVEGGVLQSSLAVWDPAGGTYVDLFADDSTGAGSVPVWAGAVAEVTDPGDGPVVFSFTSAWVDPAAPALGSRRPAASRLSLTLSGTLEGGQEVSDRSAHVRFVEGATPGWDVHDASKLVPPTDAHALVAFVGSRHGDPRRQRVLSVAPGPLSPTPIAFSSTHAGRFTLRWDGGGDLAGLELVDRETGATADLDGASDYSFSTTGPTAWTDRFEIRPAVTVPTSSDPEPSLVSVGVPYPNPVSGTATVRVRSAGPIGVSAEVFDLVGRRVATADVRPSQEGADVHVDARQLAAGLYLVVVHVDGDTSARQFTVAR